jgi:hypothetical protein
MGFGRFCSVKTIFTALLLALATSTAALADGALRGI